MNNNLTTFEFKSIEIPSNKVTLSNNKKYLKFGDNNDFPNKLIDLSIKSPTHQAVLNYISQCIAGEGFITTDQELLNFLSNQDYYTNSSSLLDLISTDLSIFDGFYLNVIFNHKNTVAKIVHIPYQNVRIGTPNELGIIEHFFISNDWTCYNPKFMVLPAFDYDIASEYKNQVYFFGKKHPSNPVYPLPAYTSSINWIECDYELSVFHYSNLLNGCLPSLLVQMPDAEDDAKRKQVKDDFKKQYSGSENAGKFIMTFFNDNTQKVEISPISNSNNNDLFIWLSDTITQKICTAHSLPSESLASIKTNTGFNSSGEELLLSQQIFENTKIQYYHNAIIRAIKDILKRDYNTSDLSIKKFMPINPLSESKNNELI